MIKAYFDALISFTVTIDIFYVNKYAVKANN